MLYMLCKKDGIKGRSEGTISGSEQCSVFTRIYKWRTLLWDFESPTLF